MTILEKKIQQRSYLWFKNEHVSELLNEGFINSDNAKALRNVLHANINELPVFKGVRMPKTIRGMLDGWCRTAISMGLKKGVADFSLKCPVAFDGKEYHFVEIEFKTTSRKSKQSEWQIKYELAVNHVGGLYVIIRSFEEFKAFIEELIFLTRR